MIRLFIYLSFQAISCHYADSACEYIECDNTVQDFISKEVTAVFKRKTGLQDARFQVQSYVKIY